MKIFIIDANGRVARALTDQLLAQGHTVYAGVYDVKKLKAKEQLFPVAFDLHSTVEEMAESFKGMDAIYFLAGSRGKDLLQTDAFGAVKTMQAAQQTGVFRYIMLSSLFATEPQKWNQLGLDQLTNYNIAKYFADNYLMTQTNLDYTILQPGGLDEGSATGRVNFAPKKVGRNPIADVALVLAKILQYDHTISKLIQMTQGQEELEKSI
ncbi:NAD(P)H-binding protein [Streptococcus dentapri]|uniref:NAD(P)H-binding protein n=1 Tax=Streptococcus dentapri TaxID=573564 RepID=A0ABV8D2N0_9STRE